jgi:hypothetical protein
VDSGSIGRVQRGNAGFHVLHFNVNAHDRQTGGSLTFSLMAPMAVCTRVGWITKQKYSQFYEVFVRQVFIWFLPNEV